MPQDTPGDPLHTSLGSDPSHRRLSSNSLGPHGTLHGGGYNWAAVGASSSGKATAPPCPTWVNWSTPAGSNHWGLTTQPPTFPTPEPQWVCCCSSSTGATHWHTGSTHSLAKCDTRTRHTPCPEAAGEVGCSAAHTSCGIHFGSCCWSLPQAAAPAVAAVWEEVAAAAPCGRMHRR